MNQFSLGGRLKFECLNIALGRADDKVLKFTTDYYILKWFLYCL